MCTLYIETDERARISATNIYDGRDVFVQENPRYSYLFIRRVCEANGEIMGLEGLVDCGRKEASETEQQMPAL